jgi:hypothetical protein
LTIFFFQCIQEERARYVEEIEDLKRQIVSKECEQQQEKDKLEVLLLCRNMQSFNIAD